MRNDQFLFMKLMEEASEIALIASKINQFGLDSNNNGALDLTNKEELFKELNDLIAIVTLLNEECNLGFTTSEKAIKTKKEKVKHYRQIAVSMNNVFLGDSDNV